MNGGHSTSRQAQVQGRQTLLDRLRAKRAGNPKPDLSHLNDMDALMKRIAARGAADFAAFQAAHPELADDEEPALEAKRAAPKRKLNVARFFKDAREAGERGTVSVEIVYAEGTRIIVTASNQPEASVEPAQTSAQLLKLIR